MSENNSNVQNKVINLIVNCRNCNIPVLISELNCRIFRHGVLKSNNTQINPHANKEECDYYIKNDLIYGCGKPFMIKDNNISICDYI